MANFTVRIQSVSVNGVGDIVVSYSADAGPLGSASSSCHVAFGSSAAGINAAVVSDAKTKMAQLNPGWVNNANDTIQVFGGAS
jgi:hypothetical protein